MNPDKNDTEILLLAAKQGNKTALDVLLLRYRDRLRQMICFRFDRRLATRFDPSDVIQDTYMKAHKRFDDFVVSRPIGFYPWLRRLAWERLVELHEWHFDTEKRSVRREQREVPLPDESAIELVQRLSDGQPSPSQNSIHNEDCDRLLNCLAELPANEKEVLVLRFLEELPINETAEVLGISEGAVSMRQLRAIKHLKQILGEP